MWEPGLPAMTDWQSARVLNLKPLSQASQLPQWIAVVSPIVSGNKICLFLQKRRTPTGVQVLTA